MRSLPNRSRAALNLLEDILNGKGTMKHLTMLEETARVIESTADCAIGYTAAQMVLKGLTASKRILWNISYTTAAAVILIIRFLRSSVPGRS